MSLRSRLVLVLGGLLVLLLGAEWALVNALTAELDEEVDDVALQVGSSVMGLFVGPDGAVAPVTPVTPVDSDALVTSASATPRVDPPPLHEVAPAPPAFPSLEHVDVQIQVAPGATHSVSIGEFDLEAMALGHPGDALSDGPRVRRFGRSFSLGGPLPSGAPEGFPGLRMPSGAAVEVLGGSLEVVILESAVEVEWDEDFIAPLRALEEQLPDEVRRQIFPEGLAQAEFPGPGLGPLGHGVIVKFGAHELDGAEFFEGFDSLQELESLEILDGPGSATFGGSAPAAPSVAAAPPHQPGLRPQVLAGAASPGESQPSTTQPSPTQERRHSIPIPRGGLDEALAGFRSRLLAGSIGLLIVGLGAIGWVAHRITRPLRSLADTADRVGQGQLGATVDVEGDREVAATLRAFNSMSARLEALDAEAQRLREREHLGELGDVARGLAHALRNPLHTLGLSVDRLAAGAEDSAAVARGARAQIERIDDAVRGFMTLVGGGGERSAVDLADVARDVALELVQRGGADVEVHPDGALQPLDGVAAELRAVLHTLVVNAVEASDDATEPVVVSLHAAANGTLEIEVQDRGSGLDPNIMDRLFTPHVTTKAHGAGMGLFLARRIVTSLYGGSLVLEARAGGGTVARLVLPAAGRSFQDAGQDAEQNGATA